MNWEVIVAVIIAVIGWIVTYILNIKAQRRAFSDQIMNEARLIILKVLREYQRWLIQMKIESLRLYDYLFTDSNKNYKESDFFEQLISFRKLLVQPNSTDEWITVLEEHEILFPETRNVRILLLDKHRKIRDMLMTYSYNYKSGLMTSEISNQIAMIEDLRVYFQNKTLHAITGNVVPAREPKDPSSPKIVECKGKLIIVDSQDS